MAYRIAISGKGGVGKTTFAALTIRFLTEELGKAVLAVDADPNATLGAMLGIQADATVADLREETLEKKDELPKGMSKDRFVEYKIQQCIVEHKGFDLLTMGRPEGPGCYCFVNSLLRRYLERAAGDYPYVVIDNEAGMEHLSRRTDGSVDLLLIVTEPTVVGAETAGRIAELARKLRITVKKKAVVLNRVSPSGVPDAIRERLAATKLPVAGEIPVDEAVAEASAAGRSLLELPANSLMLTSVREILGREVERGSRNA
jgi:CO dehydrogenase maturation factor